ncbi:MAG: stage II sporulation protein M [Acidimicrobiia bacterium]
MGTLDEFVTERAPVWNELERLVDTARGKPSRLGADGVRRLGSTYRATTADLAIARRQFPGDPLLGRLERLVLRARTAVYHSARGSGTFGAFVTHGYWRRVRERIGLVAIALICLFGPALLGGYWAWRDPGAAIGVVPGQFQYVSEPRTRGEDWGVSVDDQAAFSSEIFTNNIRVAILAFAGGILLGVGALYLLLYNGLILGATFGIAVGAGNGPPLFQQVLAHGILELSCIAVAGAAGMRMGWAIIDPGARPRSQALREEARAAAEMLLGTAAWLVIAGLVEGFVTPSGESLATVLTIGIGLGIAFWGGVFWLGRPRAGSPATAARAP